MDELIVLGHVGEIGAKSVTLSLDEFKDFGAGTYRLIHLRPSDEEPYEVTNISVDGNVLTWVVSPHDIEFEGIGFAEIQLQGDNFLVKSHKYTTYIKPSM